MISNFFFRMMISGILLSCFWGWLVYIYQANQIKKELFLQLEKAGQNIVKEKTMPFDKINKNIFETFIYQHSQQLPDFRIVMLDIYGTNDLLVYHFDNNLQSVNNDKKIRLNDSPFYKHHEYSMFKFENDLIFRTFNPIYVDEQYLGAINIMVVVGKRIMLQFKKALIIAILHAIGTISTMTFILFPLIYTSYKRLQNNRYELMDSHLQTIKALGNAIAERDSETDGHNYRVTYLSLRLAKELDQPNHLIKSLAKGAFLHDIGKIGIRDSILLKTSKLSNDEMAIMRTHVEQGLKIISNISWLEDAIDVIRFHHERYDGSGYPSGIIGEQIPIVARIFAVVDVFDAIVSKRPYKQAIPYNDAIEILNQESQKYDPWVFSNFLKISESQYADVIVTGKIELEKHLMEELSIYFDHNYNFRS